MHALALYGSCALTVALFVGIVATFESMSR